MAQAQDMEKQQRRSNRNGAQRKRTRQEDNDSLTFQEEQDLKKTINLSKQTASENGSNAKQSKVQKTENGSKVKNGRRASDTRPDKGDSNMEYDQEHNRWHPVLVKSRRLITKLATQQHFLETFSCLDQTRSKVVKQKQEVQKCKEAVKKCWEDLQECIAQCERVEGHRRIPDHLFDEHEELAAEHILCSACGNEEADDANDILLCDGHGCSRAYHVKCLPFKQTFVLQQLLDSDEGWLCPACDCRYDILWDLSQALDLDFEHLVKVKACDLSVLAPVHSTAANTILSMDLPSSDEEDDDEFDPEVSDAEEAQPDLVRQARDEAGCSHSRQEEPNDSGVITLPQSLPTQLTKNSWNSI